MKLKDIKKDISVLSSGSSNSTSYRIDGKDMHLAIQAFYQYSNPIGAIVREITSNAYDAHIEAGVTDKPIFVELLHGIQELRITDFGIGMSPERVQEVYTKFFSSTKRDTDSELGAFGLGSKSPFSYTEMFQIITKHDGMLYEYVVHKSAGIPELLELDARPWKDHPDRDKLLWDDEHDGTRISIPVQDSDIYDFQREIVTQLIYFDDVYIHLSNNSTKEKHFNESTLHKGDNIIYRVSEDNATSSLHICMGKVYYPLTLSVSEDRAKKYMEKLNTAIRNTSRTISPDALKRLKSYTKHAYNFKTFINSFIKKFSGALYFDIGELPIMWHRENVEYTSEAFEKIWDKLIQAILEVAELIEKQFPKSTTAKEVMLQEAATLSTHPILTADVLRLYSHDLHVAGLHNASSVSFSIFFNQFAPLHADVKATMYSAYGIVCKALQGRDVEKQVYYINVGDSRKVGLKDYMFSKVPHLLYHLPDIDAVISEYYFHKSTEDKVLIKKYGKEVQDIVRTFPEVNTIEIPESFSKSAVKVKKTSELTHAYTRYVQGDFNVQYRSTYLVTKERPSWTEKNPKFVIYGFSNERKLINTFCLNNRGTMCRPAISDTLYSAGAVAALIAKTSEKEVQQNWNSLHIKTLLSHRRGISRIATNYIIYKLVQKYPVLWNSTACYQEWEKLQRSGIITNEELRKARIVCDYTFKKSNSDLLIPYINRAIKQGFYYHDEIELIKWFIGMSYKYFAILDSPIFAKGLKGLPGYDLSHILKITHPNIHPKLVKKYYDKRIT